MLKRKKEKLLALDLIKESFQSFPPSQNQKIHFIPRIRNESQKHTPIDRLKLDPQDPLSRAPLYETVLLASLGIQVG